MSARTKGPSRLRRRSLIWIAAGLGSWLGAARLVASTVELLPDLPGYVHELLGVEDGLPAAGIAQILQTRDGYLWLATFDGLVRYDGVRFELLTSEQVPALGSNRIHVLAESRDGVLWLLTEQGHLVRHENGSFTACGEPQAGRAPCTLAEPGSTRYTAVYQDPGGALWVGGRSGAFRVDGAELRQVPGLDTETPVEGLLVDREDRLWATTRDEVWRGSAGRFERLALPPGWPGEMSDTLAEDAVGGVWVGAARGVARWQGDRFAVVTEGLGYVVEGAEGTVWVGTPNGLLLDRGGRLETIAGKLPEGHGVLPAKNVVLDPGGEPWVAWGGTLLHGSTAVLSVPFRIASLSLSSEGTLWINSGRSGSLHALHPARLGSVYAGLSDTSIYPLFEDADGTLWAGGFGFLARLAPGATRFQTAPGPTSPFHLVSAFLRDRAGTLWVGTSVGLFTYDGRGFARAGTEALRLAGVGAIYEDRRGVLWVGAKEGLFRGEPAAEGKRWTELTAAEGLPHPWVRVIRETADGALWLGTNGGGVIRYADGRFTAVTRDQGLSSDLVRAIHVAADGKLWIATENRGINRLDPASVGRPEGPAIGVIGERQGLYSNGVHALVPDDAGNLWMSSNQGVFRARLADLEAVADGRLTRLETVAFSERDGMANREANGSTQNSGLRDHLGRIWFPTQMGAVCIDPRRALSQRPPPRVRLERLRAGDDQLALSGPAAGDLRLSPEQRSFALEFTAPSFQAPERQRFRYRLRPYEREWVEAGGRRQAFYTKVPPGRYVFEVVGRSADGEWNAEPASVGLYVVPRFFETRSFALLCGLGLAGVFLGLVYLRGARARARQRELVRLVEERTATIAEQAEKLRELDQLKSQFFANVSHEFRTPLTLTLGPLDDALRGELGPLAPALARELGVAQRNARRLLGMVDQLLDVAKLDAGRLELHVRRGDFGHLLRRQVESFLPWAERRRISLSLSLPVEPVELYFDERELEKVFDNLLANALKFTPEGGRVEVSLATRPGKDAVEVNVRDDGPGIPLAELERVFDRFHQVEGEEQRRFGGSGIGLALARQLVELHRGMISVASTEGQGSCFTVTLLAGSDHFPADWLLTDEAAPGEPAPAATTVPSALDLDGAMSREKATSDGVNGANGTGLDQDRTTVLVIDDNAEIRAYIRRHLEPAYRVLEAADGDEGLEAARRFVPDVVVSDVMMPGLDGNELFRALRQDPELELVPVVLLTAKASAESRLEGLREGVDDYLVKPFDPRELRARLDNLLAGRKRLLSKAETLPRPLRVSEIEATPADQAFLLRVQTVVEERLGDSELSVEALASALRCERSYLLRKLRALTGEAPSELIRSFRLQRAEQLLRAGAGAVGEIAYTVGFKSVAHFSNAFQARYGERPSAFAARHRST